MSQPTSQPQQLVSYRPASLADLDRLTQIIEAASLPARFLPEFIDGFIVAEQDGPVVACGGLEPYRNTGVIRSLAVEEKARGSGIGGRLVEMLEAAALARSIEEIFVYTVEAFPFWQRRGYTEIGLEDWAAPARRCWQYRYVTGNLDSFREMGLRSLRKRLV